MKHHALGPATAIGHSTGEADVTDADGTDELGLLDGVDRVTDQAVDRVRGEPGVGERGDDRLTGELGLAPACRLGEVGVTGTDDRGRAGQRRRAARAQVDLGLNTGTAMSFAVGTNVTTTGIPMATFSGSTSTRLLTNRMPSSRSTSTATTG
jgi:hypothetical protein